MLHRNPISLRLPPFLALGDGIVRPTEKTRQAVDKEKKTAAMHATIYDTETGLNGFLILKHFLFQWVCLVACPVSALQRNETILFLPNANEGSGHCHSSSFFLPTDSLAKRSILLYLNDPTLGQLTKCWSLAGLEASEPPNERG